MYGNMDYSTWIKPKFWMENAAIPALGFPKSQLLMEAGVPHGAGQYRMSN